MFRKIFQRALRAMLVYTLGFRRGSYCRGCGAQVFDPSELLGGSNCHCTSSHIRALKGLISGLYVQLYLVNKYHEPPSRVRLCDRVAQVNSRNPKP